MAHRALRAVWGRDAAAHPRSAKNSYNKNNPAEAGLQNVHFEGKSALAELRCATSSLQTVLNISMVRFSLILRAFSHFLLSVVLFLNHGNR